MNFNDFLRNIKKLHLTKYLQMQNLQELLQIFCYMKFHISTLGLLLHTRVIYYTGLYYSSLYRFYYKKLFFKSGL